MDFAQQKILPFEIPKLIYISRLENAAHFLSICIEFFSYQLKHRMKINQFTHGTDPGK